jgi:hypothetical protein
VTASIVGEPSRARPVRWAAHRSPEALVFSGATAVALLHALDDAFLHRQPGVGVGQHALAAGLALVLGLGAIYVSPYTRPGLRSAIALVFGALAIVNGVLHVKHIAGQGAAASDLTGVLAAAAGVVLVGLAIAIPWLHRGEGPAGPRRQRPSARVLLSGGSESAGLVSRCFRISSVCEGGCGRRASRLRQRDAEQSGVPSRLLGTKCERQLAFAMRDKQASASTSVTRLLRPGQLRRMLSRRG